MSYQVFILPSAKQHLSKLPKKDYERVRDAIGELANDSRPPGCKKLVGRDGWRIRVGVYRVIYEVEDAKKMVTVLHIGHRRDVYS